jgi:hypothetical protein
MSDDEQIAGGGVGNDDIFDSTPTKQERDGKHEAVLHRFLACFFVTYMSLAKK